MDHHEERRREEHRADLLAELARRRAELSRIAERLAALTARAVSPDRLVAVTVDSRGVLIDLQIENAALRRYRAGRLAELITALVADADATLREHRRRALSAAAGMSPGYDEIAEVVVG
ncbi:MAG: YbaB/EbfC family nucleoid-associated protein [Gordonia sp. (in: high G+C Gram-positive bacteria)]